MSAANIKTPVEIEPNQTAPTVLRRLRRDAEANRDRVLEAATVAVMREGEKVPIATIARDAGVGVATIYRSFPTRESLLAALSYRAFQLVLHHAERAARTRPAVGAIAGFFESVLSDRDKLVLPLHGGPVELDDATVALQAEIRKTLRSILDRGREDATISPSVTPRDIIVAGALFASPLPNVDDWDSVARRGMQIYLKGLGSSSQLPDSDKARVARAV